MVSFENVIKNSVVLLQMTEANGQQIITKLITEAVNQNLLDERHKDTAIKAVLKRELSATTAMSDGIALPHGRTDCVTQLVSMIGIHPKGIAFGASDNQPTHIFVLLLVPIVAGCNHIHFLKTDKEGE